MRNKSAASSYKTYLRHQRPSEPSDHHGRILDSQVSKVSSCGQQRLRSDCADVHAELSLRWARMTEGTFSHVATHLLFSHRSR